MTPTGDQHFPPTRFLQSNCTGRTVARCSCQKSWDEGRVKKLRAGQAKIESMATNEFRWGLSPAVPGHWRGTLKHNDFDVEIAADWIEARKEDDGQRDVQQRRAQQIVEGIVRKIGLDERTRFTPTLACSVSRFDPVSNRREINMSTSDGLKASDHVDFVLASADGTVVADSRKERMTELLRASTLYAKNNILQRMADYLLDYHSDPNKKLAPLFDIIEVAGKVFGGKDKAATSLHVGTKRMNGATGVMNDSSIPSGRHPGKELGGGRDPQFGRSIVMRDGGRANCQYLHRVGSAG